MVSLTSEERRERYDSRVFFAAVGIFIGVLLMVASFGIHLFAPQLKSLIGITLVIGGFWTFLGILTLFIADSTF